MPKPEFYVIFTGNRGRKPDKISLSKEFFGGADIDLEIKAKVIYESDQNDIINQYIIFCKVFNEQTKQHGMTRKAAAETIRICKDRNVLREYLVQREKEVVTIMMSLFDEEEIMKLYIKSERYEAAQENARETAERMIKMGKLSLEEINLCVPSISLDELKELVLHPARNHTRGLPGLHHCVVKISRRCHRIAVEILPGTDTNHAAHKSNF